MNKLLVSLPLILSFTQVSSVLANSMDVPYDCGLEPSVFSGHNDRNISGLVNAGSAIYQGQATNWDWAGLFYALNTVKSSETFSTKGPDYVLQGVPTRFKYDGSWFDLGHRWFTVRFGTSEFGSKVKKTSNWDNNAYTHLTFKYTYGPGLVWSSNSKGCMAKSVLVQKRPSISKVSLSSNIANIIKTKISFSPDIYSEAKVKNKNSKVKFIYRSEEGEYKATGWIDTYKVSGTYSKSLVTEYGGKFYVKAIINDGNFTSEVNLGVVNVGGPAHRPCPQCETDV